MRQTLKYFLGAFLIANLVVADFAKSEVNGTNQESNPIEIKGASESMVKAEEAKIVYNDTLDNLEELNQTLKNLNSDNLVSEAQELKKQKEKEAKQKAEEEAKRKAVQQVNTVSASVKVTSNGYGSVPMPEDHKNYVVQMANKYGVTPNVIFGIIKVESTFNPNAQSSGSSARGYGQFIRSTGEYVYEQKLGKGNYNHNLAFDPYINIEMIAYYISYHYKNYGNYSQALVRYNGGELGKRYADKVLSYANSL